jgi:ubiquinone/menaquinone biosynthesis C-methylase UbiE
MTTTAPNHHAHHAGFSGPVGLLAALTMVTGRGGVARLVADLAGVGAGDRVVDIGCGPGTAVRHAARLGARAVGVDPAPVMLRVARLLTVGRRGVRWVEGVAESLPLADDSATVVWSLSTVHHWTDVGAGLAEARRVLAPGGRFVALERRTTAGATGLASHGWLPAQADTFAGMCGAAGFADVEVSAHHAGRRGEVLVVRAASPV